MDPTAPRRPGALAFVLGGLGLRKYLCVSGVTLLAFGLTIGAYVYEQSRTGSAATATVAGLRSVPADPSPAPLGAREPGSARTAVQALDRSARPAGGPAPSAPAGTTAADAPAGGSVRRPVSTVVLFPVSGGETPPAVFSFYDITSQDTAASVKKKLEGKNIAMLAKESQGCNFAFPIVGARWREITPFSRILAAGEDCCALSRTTGQSGQTLTTHAFQAAEPGGRARPDTVTGAAVFSGLDGSLLTLNLRFASGADKAMGLIARHLTARHGAPAELPGGGRAWTRHGGAACLARTEGAAAVTVFYLDNIERHAAELRALAERRRAPMEGPVLALGPGEGTVQAP